MRRPVAGDHLEGTGPIACLQDAVSIALQTPRRRRQHGRLVLDHENGRAAVA
jgi:hypothetical protein